MTDVNVQFFSHQNGLVLGNNWGDLIRLLDICLVNGKVLPTILLQSIDTQTGDITLEFSANHNCLLFQIIELSGFSPANINGKYRIKGVTNARTIVLKSDLINTAITSVGIVKLASLGYEIIFRDEADVKRVYRAKNPSTNHPFIRVDESLTSPDGTTGVYNSAYAKSAIVGLLENMTHIDDYNNPDILQLPFDPLNPSFNWQISGTGENVIKGWSRWYYSTGDVYQLNETYTPVNQNKPFILFGDFDAFYLSKDYANSNYMIFSGCGLYENAIDTPYPWFLASHFRKSTKANSPSYGGSFHFPFSTYTDQGFFVTTNILELKGPTQVANCIFLSQEISGQYNSFNNNVPAFDLPFKANDGYARGSLKHLKYAGKKVSESVNPIPIMDGNSMYLWTTSFQWASYLGFYVYLGEIQ